MSQPLLLIENLFSATQFPGHTVSADEAADDYPASRAGRASRLASNRWEPTTANAEHWIRVECDQVRYADAIVIDRETNLLGYQVILEGSDDNFVTTAVEIFNGTLPSSPGGRIDDDLGCVTEELAWLKRFSGDAHRHWRLRIPAMGTDLIPQIGALWLGRAWQLAGPPDAPYADDYYQLAFTEVQIDSAWLGASAARSPRRLRMMLRLEDDSEYEQARYHIDGHYRRRRPLWVCWNPEEYAERAALFVPQPGPLGFNLTVDWPYRMGEITGIEHEPLLDGS